MAKITNHQYKQYNVSVSYSLRYKKFEIKLPDELAMHHGIRAISDKTQDEVQLAFNRIVDAYIKDGAARKKFIAVSVENKSYVSDNLSRANGKNGFLSLSYAVLFQVIVNGKPQYRYIEQSGLSREKDFYYSATDCMVFIEWTPEREEFLAKTVQAIAEMADKVRDFMEDDNIANLIDMKQGMPLLEVKS